MKLFSALALTAVLGTSLAFADNPPASTATPPAKTSSTASTSTSTKPSCSKQATAKKLTGADRTQFIKDCKAGKTSS
jgi:hypothetical protein